MTESSSIRTLKRALEHAGSLPRLAERLQVPETALQDWLDGGATIPLQVYLAALDLVSQGPLYAPARNRRPDEQP